MRDNGNGRRSVTPWRSAKRQRYETEHTGSAYDRRYESGLNSLNTLVERGWIASHAWGKVLDAGAGTGRFAADLQGPYRSVVALDSSASMLKTLAEKAPSVARVRSDIYSLALGDNIFDAVVCMHVLFHLEDWPEVLSELARVVRPGGLVIFEMRSGDHVRLAQKVRSFLGLGPIRSGETDPALRTVYATAENVREAMGKCGLSLFKCFAYDFCRSYYLAPLAGFLEKLMARFTFLRKAAAALELLLGPVLPVWMTYRTLHIGRKR